MGVFLQAKHYSKDFDMGYGSFMRLRNSIADYVPEQPLPGTVSFLEQPDCDGKLTAKECKELYSEIKDMPDSGERYGYAYCQRTLTDFKELLQTCIRYRVNLYWH